jgi:fibronectin type 3 domain-containing protein
MYAPPGAHKARTYFLQLTWVDSTDPNAASNNIYRGTTSGGPYTLINNVPDGIQFYNDFAVNIGTTYFYVLTEVNNVGAESQFGPEQSGTPGFIP